MGTERFKCILFLALIIVSLMVPAVSILSVSLSPAAPEGLSLPIYIEGDDNFIHMSAVSSSSGTLSDPYITGDWDNLLPSDDAYVRTQYPNYNYNTDKLIIGTSDWGFYRTWLKFDLSGIPFFAQIESAKLWLYFCGYGDDGGWYESIGAYFSSDDSWSENTLTWNSQPSFASKPTGSIPSFTDICWKSWDVTPDVQREFEGDKKVAFCIKAVNEYLPLDNIYPPSNWNEALSKEFENVNYRPHLEVVCTPGRVFVSILPTYEGGVPGETLSYIVTVKNTCENEDNYTLTVNDNAGWGPILLENLLENVHPGEKRTVIMKVTVPFNTQYCNEDNICVTAIPQGYPSENSSSWCIAHTARSRKLSPTDDSFVKGASPDSNYGSHSLIGVGHLDGPRRGFLKFDFSTIPKNAFITEAKLYLYCELKGRETNIQCHSVDNDNWSEDTITWNNKPRIGEVLDGPYLAVFQEWNSWTVTSFVKEDFFTDKIASFCLVDVWENINTMYHLANFRSKEYEYGAHPYIEVTYVLTPVHDVSVKISPSYASDVPGATLNYTFTVRNMGNVSDNYSLIVSDNAGWNPTLPENLLENVEPSENRIVTLSAAVPENATSFDEDNITVTATSVENSWVSDNASCVAHVQGKAEFALVTPYKLSLDADLYLGSGSKLVVKFYTWGYDFEGESIFENFIPPAHIVKFENVIHPENGQVHRAMLVLTDNAGNVIQTMATFTLRRSDLIKMISKIKSEWHFAPPERRPLLIMELSDIKLKWSLAPE